MAAFEEARWAEAFIAAAGAHADEAVDALESLAEAVAAAGIHARGFRGESAAGRIAAATGGLSGLPDGAETARRLIVLLARCGRLPQVGLVASAARAALRERAGIVLVRAETAYPLEASSRDGLREALARSLGANRIELEEKVDPELLGGVRLSIGWERIDGSLRGRLGSLAEAIGAAKRGGGTW